jgi:carbonic anhydrase
MIDGIGLWRTVAGHTAPILHELVALDSWGAPFSEIMVVHHTDCGTTHFDPADMRARVNSHVAPGHEQEVEALGDFGAIPLASMRQSIVDDVNVIKNSPLVREELKARTTGYLYDLETGLLESIPA